MQRPLPGLGWAWAAFFVGIVGTAARRRHRAARARVRALHLLSAADRERAGSTSASCWWSPASWIWCVIMIVAMAQVEARPTRACPCRSPCSRRWPTRCCGCGRRSASQPSSCSRSFPQRSGWTQTVDVGLSRTLFSWTLHAIVYFWLFPAYIAFYTMAPRGGGRPALQRHDGPPLLHPVPGLLPARRHAPSVHGSGTFDRIQVPADDADRARDGARPC